MKAILIDSKNQEVREVSINPENTLQEWYKHIDCDLVQVAIRLNKTDSVMVDEEGLLSLDEDTMFFTYKGAGQPFIGNGLVVGCNEDGDTISCKIDVEEVRKNVIFYDYSQLYEMAKARELARSN